MEGNERVEVVDMLLAHLSMTAQPPDDDVLSETELESDNKVTIVSFRPAPGPSVSMTVLSHDDMDISETKLESDEEDTIVSNTINYPRALSPCQQTKQVDVGQRAGVICIKWE
jgi:hypothetical protein